MPFYVADALTICAHTNTYVAVLKKSIDGKSYSADSSNKIWNVVFDYTTVDGNSDKVLTGMAACNGVSSTVNTALTNLYTTPSDIGTNCWCKIYPITEYGLSTGLASYWVLFKDDYLTDEACAESCTEACALAIKNNTNGFRAAVFDSIK